MRYDINLIKQLCLELGLSCVAHADKGVDVTLGPGIVLQFLNAKLDQDCLVGFESTPWHAHDDLMFVDGQGNYIELDYLELLTGLAEGSVLVCEMYEQNELVDRWLIHRDYNDEFKYMESCSEKIVIWRAVTNNE